MTRPSENAGATERSALMRLALELLEPEDRKVILLRQWHEMSFPEIGAELGMAADAARMRFQRALPKLGVKLIELRSGTCGSDPDTDADGAEAET